MIFNNIYLLILFCCLSIIPNTCCFKLNNLNIKQIHYKIKYGKNFINIAKKNEDNSKDDISSLKASSIIEFNKNLLGSLIDLKDSKILNIVEKLIKKSDIVILELETICLILINITDYDKPYNPFLSKTEISSL